MEKGYPANQQPLHWPSVFGKGHREKGFGKGGLWKGYACKKCSARKPRSQVLYQIWEAEQTDGNQRQQRQQQQQQQQKWKQPSKWQQDVKNQAGVEQGVGRVEPSITYARVRERGWGAGGSLDESKIRAGEQFLDKYNSLNHEHGGRGGEGGGV